MEKTVQPDNNKILAYLIGNLGSMYTLNIIPHDTNLKNNFVKNEKDKVSIEHIYPQTPSGECWNYAFENLEEDRKKRLTNMLGNLLLLSQSINSSLQNICFADKIKVLVDDDANTIRNGYANGSYSEQKVASLPTWNATQIEIRSLELLNFLEKRWNITIGDNNKKKEMLLLIEEVKN